MACSCFRREARVKRVEILRVEPLRDVAQPFAEALVMHHLPLAQEPDDVRHVRVVGQLQDVVVRDAGFLFGRMLSCKSAIGSPFTARHTAENGAPDALTG